MVFILGELKVMELYALFREGYDEQIYTKYYLDKMTAIDEMIRFAIGNTLVAGIYVYNFPDTPTSTFRLCQTIDFGHNLSIYNIAEQIGKDEVLNTPSLLYEHLVYKTF